MRIFFLVLAVVLSGCAQQPRSDNPSHYGSYPWWYDDYLYYWDHYYPWCCDNDNDIAWLIKDWWHSLDEGQQQAIKDKFDDWQGDHQQADITALKSEFQQRWAQISPEQQANLRARRDELKNLPRPSNKLVEHPKLQERPVNKPELPKTRPATKPTTRPAVRPVHFPQRPMARPGRRR